jgi:hypothetical protein
MLTLRIKVEVFVNGDSGKIFDESAIKMKNLIPNNPQSWLAVIGSIPLENPCN